MNPKERIQYIENLFIRHNYTMTTYELTLSKVYYKDIQFLLNENLIERLQRGYYHWLEDVGQSDIFVITRLFPDVVLCMETALLYYGYTDRNPIEWNFCIDRNTSRTHTQLEYPYIKVYRMKPDLLLLGNTLGEIDFVKMQIYDRDRTICDVLRNMHTMDKEIFNKAIQGYIHDPKKNIPNLIK